MSETISAWVSRCDAYLAIVLYGVPVDEAVVVSFLLDIDGVPDRFLVMVLGP